MPDPRRKERDLNAIYVFGILCLLAAILGAVGWFTELFSDTTAGVLCVLGTFGVLLAIVSTGPKWPPGWDPDEDVTG